MMTCGILSKAVVRAAYQLRPVGAAVRTLSTLREPSYASHRLSYPVISKEDFGSFKEYSVIHTDRSLNLMSDPFQRVMRDLNQLLKVTYNADKVAIIPGYVFNVVPYSCLESQNFEIN